MKDILKAFFRPNEVMSITATVMRKTSERYEVEDDAGRKYLVYSNIGTLYKTQRVVIQGDRITALSSPIGTIKNYNV